jgi:hypothetical protein
MTSEIHFKDFSKVLTPIQFQVDSDYFSALPTLPIPVMQQLIQVSAELQGKTMGPEALTDVLGVFDIVLMEESRERFKARLQSTENPVSLTQVMDIMVWLMELYGKRPTQQSSDSSSGLPTETVGTISTAGVPSIG